MVKTNLENTVLGKLLSQVVIIRVVQKIFPLSVVGDNLAQNQNNFILTCEQIHLERMLD